MISSKFNKFIILIGIPILLWQCYWYVGFNQNLTKMIDLSLSLVLLIVFAKRLFQGKKKVYNQYINYIVVIYLLSIVMALVYWGQSPVLTFRAGVGPLMMLYYYVLQKMKVTERELLIIIIILAVIYTLLWLYAVFQAPNVVFGNLEEIQNDRGFYRVLQLRSLDVVCLLFFFSLVQLIKRAYNTKWLIICIVCFVVIFLALSRMFIFAVLLVSIFFILRKRIMLAFVIGIVLAVSSDKLTQNEIVSKMVEMTQTQLEYNEEENLRMTEYNNMFTAYPFHIGTMLFGNGSAHVQSNYGQYEDNLKWNMNFNRSDAGYVGIYITYGITMLILLFLLLFHVALLKVPMNYQPFRLFIFFLYIDNIASYSFWGYGISFAISLYALSIAEEKYKYISQKRRNRNN